MEEKTVWCANFDIGKKNFSFYVEEVDIQSLSKYTAVAKGISVKYNDDGTPVAKMVDLLDKICMSGKTIVYKNTDLTENCAKGSYLDPETFHNMYDLLETYSEYWDQCSYFVIEQQMNFGKRKNPMAMKLGQHCYSYFIFKYGRNKKVIEFPSYHKTQVLGAPKVKGKTYKNGKSKWVAMEQRARKKWSVKVGMEILERRGEKEFIKDINTVKKRDDLCDCFLMGIAFLYKKFIEGEELC